ncbi:MAG: AMP-binding protein [Candidatus Omnitrophica bacterium]|nr:AMP-binding protein [Candidatus Omnitrophota bacterium]MDE2009043.1 AMP-binding protein [Candidatus Omnitrophota bacterium]MDE2214292.1 AMP-binding protein [Candidatus Omnitrophota bacterium]MDE2231329.1 AMP-binding protein [Candidatus Omnitrophota bacterium]
MDSWKAITSLTYSQIKELQNRRLHSFINTHVYPFSPYYRNLFDDKKIDPKSIRTREDLKRIPFINKSDLLDKDNPQKFKDFILQPDKEKIKSHWPKTRLLGFALKSCAQGRHLEDDLAREYRPIFMTFTTGTTNAPVPFMYSRRDLDNLNLFGARMVGLFGIKSDERIMNLFPFAPHLAFWQTFFGAIEAGVFSLSTGGGKVMGTEGNLTALMRIKPSTILGVPSYIYHLVRFAQTKGHDLSFLKNIVLGAARVTPAYKQKLSAMLRAQGGKDICIFGTYGFTEARCAWAECPTENHLSSGYHLYPDKEIFEIIDPDTGEIRDDGADGELVYTNLDARASVVLRYRTGDFVKGGISHGPCPYCGRVTLRLSSDITRLSDQKDIHLSKVKGTLVNLSHFTEVLSGISQINEWQLEIRKHNNDPFEVDEIIVYVTAQEGVDQLALSKQIIDKLTGATEVAPNQIEFIPLAEMVKRLELETANKEKRILDTRPKG